MNAQPRRKRRTSTAREASALRWYYKHDPVTYALPLAATLARLSEEYRAADNLVVARRHINAALKVMRPAMQSERIPENSRRRIVELLRDSSHLHIAQGQWLEARAAIAEALRWDALTWEAHDFCLSYRELRRAYMLQTLAFTLEALGDAEGANDARAEAVLVAMSDSDCESADVSRLASSLARDIAHSRGFVQA